jgi:hypothetical protein
MTLYQVQNVLERNGFRFQMTDDKRTAMAYRMVQGRASADDGQITFDVAIPPDQQHVIYANYKYPAVSADELAQEIAGAANIVESKRCVVSNDDTHAIGLTISQTIFECGLQRFVVETQEFSELQARQMGITNRRTTTLKFEIGTLR